MGKAKTHPDFIETAERRNVALQLRKQGGTYRAIASRMIEEFGAGALPKGYDERYVYNDVMAVLDALNEELSENAKEVRRLELERLDELLRKQYRKAVNDGDNKAVSACLRIMKRRADLMGLDAPKRTELTGADGEPMKVEMVQIGGIDPEKDI
jgi:hypothetical protein